MILYLVIVLRKHLTTLMASKSSLVGTSVWRVGHHRRMLVTVPHIPRVGSGISPQNLWLML